MQIMVYFKGPKDTRFAIMNPLTGELHSRLLSAPCWPEKMIPAFSAWIDHNKTVAPECKLQIRRAGTQRIIYS
jgi:hypothetical protein